MMACAAWRLKAPRRGIGRGMKVAGLAWLWALACLELEVWKEWSWAVLSRAGVTDKIDPGGQERRLSG